MLFILGLLSSISSTRYAATCVLCCPWMRTTHTHPHFLSFCDANPALFSCCVVQRQLTDVSDSTNTNLPQLLTSIHKSQLMRRASPKNVVTLLQTCKAVYKVVTNVIEGIFSQVENVTTDSQEVLFPPKPMGAGLDSSKSGSARWSCSAKRQAT